MNNYKIKYFTSGGFKASGHLKTNYIINKNDKNELCIFHNNEKIGDVNSIEILFLEQLGYQEEITIFYAELE